MKSSVIPLAEPVVFLTQTMDYLKQKFTSPGLEEQEMDDSGQADPRCPRQSDLPLPR